MADYFKDVPGYSPGGVYVWVLQEAFKIAKPMLDQAGFLTFVKVGLAMHDVTIVLFTNKYIFNIIRPVTYIRAYIIQPGILISLLLITRSSLPGTPQQTAQ